MSVDPVQLWEIDDLLSLVSNDPRVIAIYFLVAAVLTLLVCFDIYFAFPYSVGLVFVISPRGERFSSP